MKVYTVGGSTEDVTQIKRICNKNNWVLKQLKGMGRPKVEHDFQKVLRSYKSVGTVSGAAKALGLTSGTIWRILKDHGALKSRGAEGPAQTDVAE